MNRTVMKTVKMYSPSYPEDSQEYRALSDLFDAYGQCKDMFLQRFSGIRSMLRVRREKYRIRNELRAQQRRLQADHQPTYKEQYSIQERHWTMAFFDAMQCINSMWTNLAARIRRCVRDNPNLTDTDRSYCFIILSNDEMWSSVLLEETVKTKYPKYLEVFNALTEERKRYLHSYIRRKTRQHKPSPRCTSNRSMLLDQEMYRIAEDQLSMELMSATKGRRLNIPFRGKFCYNRQGNLQLVLDREHRTVTVYKAIQARIKRMDEKQPVGVDKGYATLLSVSNDREYGDRFGELFTQECERINTRNTNRNPYIQKVKDCRQQIRKYREQAEKKTEDKRNIEQQIRDLEAKIRFIQKHNLGSRRYHEEHRKAMAHIESELNHAIRQCLDESRPSVVAKEDLSFMQEAGRNSKLFNRKMSSWCKGRLDERLEYICSTYGIRTVDVSAAYTSRYCHTCGAPLIRRTGVHHETGLCPNCGEINANTNAAKNILARLNDPEIKLYTPYRQIREILDLRYANSCNNRNHINNTVACHAAG